MESKNQKSVGEGTKNLAMSKNPTDGSITTPLAPNKPHAFGMD